MSDAKPPCDCIERADSGKWWSRCYCSNRDDGESAAAWCVEANIGARVKLLEGVLGALGVINNGYCFCSHDRDPDKADHQPECRDARAALAQEKQ